ncbi:hypothetical protein RAS1_15510 [Phycisphaerae bacterium RAS1]|nr:hypothetical protein RAS1_15510 [Phycisphaerae bacterium RAS1]
MKRAVCRQGGRSGFLAMLAVVTATILLGMRPPPARAQLPTGFIEETVIGGFNQAAGLCFDGQTRMFVWEKGGVIWLVENGVRRPTPVIDLNQEVYAFWDHGLMGVALDPDFAANRRIYLLYPVDWQWYVTGGNPNPNLLDLVHDTFGRLVRYTLTPQYVADPASRTILIGQTHADGIPQTSGSHSVDTLAFADDGTLLLSCGDGAMWWGADTGGARPAQFSTNTAEADGILSAAEQVGAFRAQLLDSHNGKILRLDPQTGAGVSSNPFYNAGDPDSPRSRVWCLGFRNPFRFCIRPGTGSTDPADADPGTLVVGDVGMDTWEELSVARSAARNCGWPLFEGLTNHATYAATNVNNVSAINPLYCTGDNPDTCDPACMRPYFYFRELLVQETQLTPSWPNPCNTGQQIPASVCFMHTRPVIEWRHGTVQTRVPIFLSGSAVAIDIGHPLSNVSGTAFKGATAVGGVFYSGNKWPVAYQGGYFFADSAEGWVRSAVLNAADVLLSVSPFAPSAPGTRVPVCLAADPQGYGLYYAHFAYVAGSGQIRRITFDCNGNGVGDDRDIALGSSDDCNANGIPDECDIAGGGSADGNGNGVPDECEQVLGDLNCDGVVNVLDINPFVLALSDPAAYALQHPGCNILNGDIDGDGMLTVLDINPFVKLLAG